jgi:hypothetical protein
VPAKLALHLLWPALHLPAGDRNRPFLLFGPGFSKSRKGETEMEKKPLTHQDLRQFTGDVTRYRHWMIRRVIYTPGIKHLAAQGQAYWLVDAIASYFGSNEMIRASLRDMRLSDMQFWRLDVRDDRSAVLSARADSGEEPFILHQSSTPIFHSITSTSGPRMTASTELCTCLRSIDVAARLCGRCASLARFGPNLW